MSPGSDAYDIATMTGVQRGIYRREQLSFLAHVEVRRNVAKAQTEILPSRGGAIH